MGAPEPEDRDLPFARSSISAIGARRRWRFFGGVVEDDPSSDTVSSGTSPAAAGDDGPPGRSMLSLSSGFSGPPAEDADAARFLKEARAVADEEPPVRSMLGSLADEAGRATMLSLDGTKPAAPADEEGFGHLTQHSTIGELAGLEEHVANEWP